MNFNDTNIYTYFTKPYAYGWMVYHIENRVEVMDDCFVNEETAKQVANSRNMREAAKWFQNSFPKQRKSLFQYKSD